MESDTDPPTTGSGRPSAKLERLLGNDLDAAHRRALEERTKELRCLYAVSRALFRGIALDACLREVVEAIPPGWQYPEITVARLCLSDLDVRTSGFRDCEQTMVEPIVIEDTREGWLEVGYLEPQPLQGEGPFLEEEHTLLRALAERVGETVARYRIEERLRRREAHFRHLVESAADLIAVVDPDAVVRYANPSAPAVCGYTAGELVGRRGLDLVHPDERDAVEREFFGRLEEPGAVVRMELRIRHKDGGWRHVDAVGRNLTHEADVGGVLLVARDISERKRLEEQLRHAQKMEAVGRLAGGIAHDFNNLLSVIGVQAELLVAELPEGDPRREDVQEIRRAAQHGGSLTRQLLAFSRRQVVTTQELCPNRLIGDTERMLHRLLGEDVALETTLEPGVGTVRMDPGQLEQVLLNLAVNARDAMPGGGRLRITTGEAELAQAASELPPGRCVRITVEDTGEGIPAEQLEHVFEPFFTTKKGGTGLGLSTVYGIVRQHGGDIHVASELGEGTRFVLDLPRVGEAAPSVEQPSSRPVSESAHGSETVLLVEDDDRLRRASHRVLRRNGYQVLEARTGEEASEIARQHEGPIHLLLTDVVMPEMSGPDLARALAAERPGLAVLLTSGYSGAEVSRQATIEPGTPFLEKPFTPSALTRMVRQALDPVPS